MINVTPLDNTVVDANNQTAYQRYRFDLISTLEAVIPSAYLDSKGIPTIGIGFNLQDDNILGLVLNAFGIDTSSPQSTALSDFHEIVIKPFASNAALQAALDAELSRLAGLNPPQADRPTFAFSSGVTGETEMRGVFDTAVLIYDNSNTNIGPLGRVDNWLAGIPDSYERAVLVSLSYNGLINAGTSPSLRAAIVANDRAEAWFQIRYDSNKLAKHYLTGTLTADETASFTRGEDRGVAKRRYVEADVFGLYKDRNNVTLDEAKSAYRMLQLHRDYIFKYEAGYGLTPEGQAGTRGNMVAAAVDSYTNIFTVRESFNPAKPLLLADLISQHPNNTQLMNALVADMDGSTTNDRFLSTNIYLDPGRELPDPGQALGAVDPNNNGALLSATPDTAVDEILIGEGGNDYLFAGKGNDVLVGGAGLDTYVYRMGDGNDLIADSDGQGRIVIYEADGKTALTVAAGAFTQTAVGSNTWTSADGKLTLTHDTTWTLAIQGGGAIDLGNNFATGNFGITLASPISPTTKDINGDPLIHSAAGIAPGSEDPTWRVTKAYNHVFDGNTLVSYDVDYFIVDGDGNPTEAGGPAHADTLHGSAQNDHIVSGGGTDHIYAAQGGDDLIEAGGGDGIGTSNPTDWFSDYVETGAGADHIYANSYVDTATAIAQGNAQASQDYLGLAALGGAGNDVMVGSAGNDYLAGGTGSDLLIGGAGNDVIEGNNDGDAPPTWQGVPRDDSLGFGTDNAYSFLTPDTARVEMPIPDASGDVIYAGAGSDYAIGNNGNDVIYGEDGNDALIGFGGNDVILGGNNDDIIYGDVAWGCDYTNVDGSDYLDGGAGIDQIYGNGGDDILVGGTGNDLLFGGVGRDTYIFNKGDGVDHVYDTRADHNILRFGAGVDKNNIKLHLGSLMLDLGNGDAIHIDNTDQANANGFDRNDVFNSSSISSFEFADGSVLGIDERLARGFDIDGMAVDGLLKLQWCATGNDARYVTERRAA